ncbi:DNA-binding GntR family transcriptional regulator [Murinocardiopsis flavida]|uniref:DNA-binding GntR family transcriptional regulator n=1 Tax=Murinocardiopsis flavida TaxID=645275 RepID=A0A2P8C7B5_9ACTN|nr:GntR family transcriptional regulator [Murinocardiopsis flavida]PSK80860.1 DNA-binding GntR family transcriptional regulator [Murinocardiopsis flavida]
MAPPIKWESVSSALRAEIMAGTYAPGAPLPSIADVSTRYDIGNKTARKALNDLISQGIAVAHKGRGTYVADHPLAPFGETGPEGDALTPPHTRPDTPRPRRTHAARRRAPADAPTAGDDDLHALTTTERAPAPTDIAIILGTGGNDVPTVRRILSDDHGPVALRTHYTPDTEARADATTVVTHTSARTATAEEAGALQTSRATVVLVHDETSYRLDGPAIEYTRTAYRAETIRLSDQYQPR